MNTDMTNAIALMIQQYQKTGRIQPGQMNSLMEQQRQQRQAQYWAQMNALMEQQRLQQAQQPEQQSSGGGGPSMPSNISQFWNGGSTAAGGTAGSTAASGTGAGSAGSTATGATAGKSALGTLGTIGAYIGAGLVARNAFEKGSIGGSVGDKLNPFMRQMDPNSGHSMKNLPKQFVNGQWVEWVDPVRQTTRGIKALKKLFK